MPLTDTAIREARATDNLFEPEFCNRAAGWEQSIVLSWKAWKASIAPVDAP